MKKIKRLVSVTLIFILMLLGMNIISCAYENVIYVSKTGRDSNDGTSKNDAYFTIEKALEAAKGIASTIIIQEGTYTISDVLLTSEYSGITFKGEGNVVITEAKDFSGSEFTVVKNPDILKRLRPQTWGYVYELGLGHYNTDIKDVELYVDGKKMNVARYPNRSEAKGGNSSVENPYLVAKNPLENANESIFKVSDTNAIARWCNADFFDAYVVGSFVANYNWSKRLITSVDATTDKMTISGSVRENAEFYICNLIEEIDVVGEFAYDSDANTIYAYLPTDYKTASVVFKNTKDSLITIEEADNVTFNNIKFDKISKQIFKTENTDGLSITNCEFNYIDASYALGINGKNISISSNRVYGGSGGFVKFSGGEVTKDKGFIKGNIIISNNLISNCGDEEFGGSMIVCGSNAPENMVDSIGNEILNNVIYNCGGRNAIGPTGNDLVVKNNEVLNVARHNADGGAIYSGRSNTKAGTVVSNNYIHHLNKDIAYAGLYSDDGLAGITMTNNVLYDMANGILVGAGMEGNFSDNMIIDAKKALALGSRMAWVGGRHSDPEDDNVVEGSNGWYAKNADGGTEFTFYGETAKALSEYPEAYSKYSYMEASLNRRPFFAPWNTKINGNVHFTNSYSAELGQPFYHSYYAKDGKTPLIASEAEYLKSSGKSNALSNGYIYELDLYDGEFLNNKQITNSISDYFVDFENQDFTLKNSVSNSNISNINMASIGLENTNAYYTDDSFDFYPSYIDGKLVIALDKSKNASKYIINLNDGNDPVEYFDDNSDTAYETSKVTPGETYEITVEAVNLARQNSGSQIVTKEYTVPAENDKTALSYVTALLEKENAKATADDPIYTYSDNIDQSFEAVLSSANAVIENENATVNDIVAMEKTVLDTLSFAQSSRIVNRASISSCRVTDTSTKVLVKAEDFEPYSQVTIAVTNPKYKKEDIINNTAEAVLRYTDVKRTGFSGEVEFSFNTVLNGLDMPDYYNVYLIDESGREASSSYYYGTLETSDVAFFFEGNNVSKDKLSDCGGKTLNVTINVKNRMKDDIDSTVYCGIYEDKKLISLAMTKDVKLLKNEINAVNFDIEIPKNITDNSKVEIMICDNETLLKPLTVKRSITELK